MLKISKFLKFFGVCAALAFSAQAAAATGFKVPVNYSLELVDGVESPENYSRFKRMLTLTPGRHQIVVKFENSFGGGEDSRLIQATNPLVIEIANLKKNQVITFKYNMPNSIDEAERYVRAQKILLVDSKGRQLPRNEAMYYILASETGFVMARDYRLELQALNRLYAPTYVEGAKRGIGMTEYGAPTITAPARGGSIFDIGSSIKADAPNNMVMDVPDSTAYQESGMSTSSRSGNSKGRGATFEQLLKLYNSADDATKLKFVKYVMSH